MNASIAAILAVGGTAVASAILVMFCTRWVAGVIHTDRLHRSRLRVARDGCHLLGGGHYHIQCQTVFGWRDVTFTDDWEHNYTTSFETEDGAWGFVGSCRENYERGCERRIRIT